ncbi:BTB domain-containing protein [Mycena venus]|uniref:BTB domain-containing protein n=1 Tax=Mycena venus TaxID=2733690 RepID=A0A8H7D028_9AGAR|nr:BTB domain-containing protein [Mycena venus]
MENTAGPEILGVLELEPKRVIDLWFEDGNVVIQAEDYQFCLFRSFLTTRSPIFKDTFSIPQPEDAERINGCPVLRIHDSASDAAHFFKAIFDSETFLPWPAPTTFEKIAAILRLSTKYEVEYLRRRALDHLSSGYPTSLAQWRENELPLATFPVHCLWVLPTAFYDYCKFTGPSEIFRGTMQDGVLLSLSDADKQLCLEARESQREASKDLENFLAEVVEDCTGSECSSSRLVWIRYLNKLRQDGFWLDPTETWEYWGSFAGHVCKPCLLACQKKYEDARLAVWQSIPSMFNLPSWTKLEAEREEYSS